MHFTLVPAVAGILGIVVCLASMLIPRALGIARIDVVRALGELATRNYEAAFAPGLALHFVRGIVFAYGYYAVPAYLRAIPMNALSGLFYGMILGVFMDALRRHRGARIPSRRAVPSPRPDDRRDPTGRQRAFRSGGRLDLRSVGAFALD